MSTVTTVKNNGVYEGFDTLSVKKCTPSAKGFRICADLSAEGDGKVKLKLIAETPFGNYTSKEFEFSSDIEFEYKPISRVSIKVSIKKFKVTEQTISFDLKLEGCIDLPWPVGKKCVEKTFPIQLPMLGLIVKNIEELSSGDLALLLLAAQDEVCNCN